MLLHSLIAPHSVGRHALNSQVFPCLLCQSRNLHSNGAGATNVWILSPMISHQTFQNCSVCQSQQIPLARASHKLLLGNRWSRSLSFHSCFSGRYAVKLASRSSSTLHRPPSSAFPEKKSSYYDDLNVAVDASKEEIRRAFLRLAKTHHPDTAAIKEEGSKEFQRIQIAYDVLSDTAKRREYDWKMRGIWRHNPYMQERSEKHQTERTEIWEETERGEEKVASHFRTRVVHESESILADQEAAERASELEYQQMMAKRFREIGREKEAARKQAYQAASLRYHRHIDTEDDNHESPGGSRVSHRLKAWTQYLRSFWKLRLVTATTCDTH